MAEGKEGKEDSAGAYRYSAEKVEYSFVFGERGKAWQKGELSGDGEFVCRKRGPGGLDEQLILCGGSYVQVRGGTVLRYTRPVQWAEITVTNGERTMFSSDSDALAENVAGLEQPETAAPGSAKP